MDKENRLSLRIVDECHVRCVLKSEALKYGMHLHHPAGMSEQFDIDLEPNLNHNNSRSFLSMCNWQNRTLA